MLDKDHLLLGVTRWLTEIPRSGVSENVPIGCSDSIIN